MVVVIKITHQTCVLLDIPEQKKFTFVDSAPQRRYYRISDAQISLTNRIYIFALMIFEAAICGLTQFQYPHLRSEWRQAIYGKKEVIIEGGALINLAQKIQGKSNELTGFQLKEMVKENHKDTQYLFLDNVRAADREGMLKGSFNCLHNIQHLELRNCGIRSLPLNFNSHRHLGELDLCDNRLSALPDSFCDLDQLYCLTLKNNQILLLPEDFGRLTQLNTLNVTNNHLTVLPESFAQLQNLNNLDLRGNLFTIVPECLFSLPETCTINLEGNPLSQAAKTTLIARISAPDYHGPTIHISENSRRRNDDEEIPRSLLPSPRNTFENELSKWCASSTSEKLQVEKSENRERLHLWLTRLKETKDYHNSPQKMTERVKKILDWLATEPNHSPHKSTAYFIISRANATCGDRVALSINDLSILMKVAKSKDLNLNDLKEIVVGMERYNILTKIANRKCEELWGKDYDQENREDLEVHLFYQTSLKEALKLPLEVDSMIFSASVTQMDLQNAKMEILRVTDGIDNQLKILMQSDIWTSMIAKEKDFQGIKEKCEKEKLDFLSGIDSTDDKATTAAAKDVKQKSDTIWNPHLIFTKKFLQSR